MKKVYTTIKNGKEKKLQKMKFLKLFVVKHLLLIQMWKDLL